MLGKTGSAVITKGNIVSQNAAMNTLNYKALETQYANRAKELAEQGAQVQMAQQPAESSLRGNSWDFLGASRARSSGANAPLRPQAANAPARSSRRGGRGRADAQTAAGHCSSRTRPSCSTSSSNSPRATASRSAST